ncbi:hypothetical protein P885DRAFT_43360 [Corynascus similis CBS 632.67]
MDLTVGNRGYRSSTRVGSVAPLGNTKEDNYYRNDSLKYCRHEEKKKKRKFKSWHHQRPFISDRCGLCTLAEISSVVACT